MADKILWTGEVLSIQPRIRLMRSLDERAHTYLGYILRIDGQIGIERRPFTLGIGKDAQAKHQLRRFDQVSGLAKSVADSRLEPAEFYKVSKLTLLARPEEPKPSPPPWWGVPPDLTTYRQRGHRRFDARTYNARCITCIWGCRMTVELIIDHWNPTNKRYRVETFCYGPKSCSTYKPGA